MRHADRSRKNGVVASSIEVAVAVASRIPGVTDVGTVVKKLGADYSFQQRRLAAGRPGRPGAKLRSKPGAAAPSRRQQQCRWVRSKFRSVAGCRSSGNAGVADRRATRACRLQKAGRRMARVKKCGRGRRRLFAAAVLPVAVYAAEHDRWRPEEIRQLRTAAIASCGASVPGVPHIWPPYACPLRWMRLFGYRWLQSRGG